MSEIHIKTTFPLGSAIRITNKNMKNSEGKNTIYEICRGVNILAWSNQINMIAKRQLPRYLSSTAFTRLCNDTIESLILEDEENQTVCLKGHQFDYDRFDELSYIYGEIEGDPFTTNKDTYIRCHYINQSGKEKKATFCTTNTSFNKVCDNNKNFSSKRAIFGLCIRKKIIPYKQMRYDKISHMTYEVGPSKEEKSVNKLLQFCIIDCTEYGLFCNTQAEKEYLDELCRRGELVKRVTKPYAEYGFVPTALIYQKNGICIAEILQQYNKEEQEKRLQALKKLKEKGISYQIKEGG